MGKKLIVVGLSIVCLFTGLATFRVGEVQAMRGEEYAEVAHSIATLLESSRIVLARNQDVINTVGARFGEPIPENSQTFFKGFIPARFGRLTSEEFVKRTGISLKQTTLGKGDFGPRNVYNAPDEWEEAALLKLSDYRRGEGFGEFSPLKGATNGLVYRYMLPLYIEEACLQCHGDPAISPTGDGRDISGHMMEGYKMGEFRGGISVVIPLETVETARR
ncbi:MAG: Tll0287-like domain-containing protein [Planctomycetota bacterium]|jgi:methyl-accepting chemotaxis protein